MKNPAMSLWLSAANQAAGWWMGTASAMMRAQQQAVLSEMTKAAIGKKPARKRKAKAKPRRSV